MDKEYEIRKYTEYPHGLVNEVSRSFAYRYHAGKVWLTANEIFDRLQVEEDEFEEAFEQVLSTLNAPEAHIHEFRSEVLTHRPDYRIKCYDWKVLQAVMQRLKAKNKQFLLWVKSESGAAPKHVYERLVKREEKHRQGLTQGYQFNLFDRIWYEYELCARYNHTLRIGGSFLHFYLSIAIFIVLYGLGVPVYVEIILFIAVLLFLDYHFDDRRCAAIFAHYGYDRKPKSTITLVMIPVIILWTSVMITAYLISGSE